MTQYLAGNAHHNYKNLSSTDGSGRKNLSWILPVMGRNGDVDKPKASSQDQSCPLESESAVGASDRVFAGDTYGVNVRENIGEAPPQRISEFGRQVLEDCRSMKKSEAVMNMLLNKECDLQSASKVFV